MTTIITPHDITDPEKVETLAADMQTNGWTGRPMLALDMGDHLYAITGTHRLAAAEDAEVEPRVLVIEQPAYTGDDEQAERFQALLDACDDIDRESALRELVEYGDVEQDALDIMTAENTDEVL